MITIDKIVKNHLANDRNYLKVSEQIKFYKRYFELVKDALIEGELVEFPNKGGKIAVYRREQSKMPSKKPSLVTKQGIKKVNWHDQINLKRLGWYYGTFWRHNRAHYLGYIFKTKDKLKKELAKKLKETDIEYRAYVNKQTTIN